MRFLTGDECGLLKECLVHPSSSSSSQPPQPDNVTTTEEGVTRVNPHEPMARRNAVVGLTWTIPEVRQWAALRVDGTVQVWEGSGDDDDDEPPSGGSREPGRYRLSVEIPRVFSTTAEAAGENSNEENPTGARGSSSTSKAIGIHSLSAPSHNRLVACNAAGTIAVINPFVEDDSNHVVTKFDTLASSGAKQQQQSSQQQGENAHTTTAFAVQPTTGVAAVSAKDREIVLWDLETGQRQWKAKNLPPDPQTLLQPRVWPTAACFFNTNLLAVGSAYHQVRIYDVRASQRRPVRYTLEDNDYLPHRVTALCRLNDHEFVVGDAGGYIQSLDLRLLATGANVKRHTASPVVGRFVGPAGSVRQLVAFSSSSNSNNTNNRLACVGLDRTLRVYDTTTRRSLRTVYLRQRLNCLLVAEEEENDDNDEDAAVLDDDEMMDQQDKVRDYVDTSDDDDDDDGESSVVDVVETIDEVPDDDESSEEEKEKEVAAPRRKQQRRR